MYENSVFDVIIIIDICRWGDNMILMDGRGLRDKILDEIKENIENNNLQLKLAIILVGDDEASKIYIKNKEKACEYVGIMCDKYLLDSNTSEEEVINLISKLNDDKDVTGIILQSPVPNHIDFDKCASTILYYKDVDGFTRDNIYNLYMNKKGLVPCTVKGIIRLLDEYEIGIEGKHVVIVGRGNIVGKPLSHALLNRNATVSICHSKTSNLEDICKSADILVSAVGKPNLIIKEMIKDNAVVIDVGISRVNGKVVGDTDFDNIKDKCSYITPVPGGVGPMTVAMIMDNLLMAKEMEDNG